MSKPGDYSSQSYAPSGVKPKSNSTLETNKDLLNPMERNIDPKYQSSKTIEKDQIVGLNDKFVALIDKVQQLEEKNKVLKTRLDILKQHEKYQGNVEELVQQQSIDIQHQLEGVARDNLKLEQELMRCQGDVEKTRKKYEDEFQKKTDLENDFVINKKDVDEGHLAAVDLALDLEALMEELEFLRRGYDEELKELQSQVQNETVIMTEPNNRALNMEEIIQSNKKQYEEMAARSREEAERWHERKIDDMVQKAGKFEQDARDVKKELADLLRLIQRLKAELEGLNSQRLALENDIQDADNAGKGELEQARESINELEEALRRAKHDMARQIREYQELMNFKLAMDIEIATYKKLLEGEERRMSDHGRQQDIDGPSKISLKQKPIPRNHLVIKIEVKAGKIVSQSLHYPDD